MVDRTITSAEFQNLINTYGSKNFHIIYKHSFALKAKEEMETSEKAKEEEKRTNILLWRVDVPKSKDKKFIVFKDSLLDKSI